MFFKSRSTNLSPVTAANKYGFIQKTTQASRTTQVHYELEITFEEIPGTQESIAIINRKQVYINDAFPQTNMEQMADQSGKALYPLHLKIIAGRLAALENFEEIIGRWETIKKELLQYFVGEYAEAQIQFMNDLFKDEKIIFASLSKDWFFILFFSGFPVMRNQFSKGPVNIQYPVFPFAHPVNFSLEGKYERYTTNKKNTILISGHCIEEKSLKDIVQNRPVPEQNDPMQVPGETAPGSAEWFYRTEDDTNAIFSITGNVILGTAAEPLRKIEIEIYLLSSSTT